MPRGDRTGPGGMGPMTGRAAGYCAGIAAPGYANFGAGGGFGMGFGRGRGAGGRGNFGGGGYGRRNMFYATGQPGWMRGGYAGPDAGQGPFPAADQQIDKQALKRQAEGLQSQLDAIHKRLDELSSTGGSE